MGELLFIATIIFVAYVVFVVIGEKKDTTEPSKSEPVEPETKHPEVTEPEKNDPPPAAVEAPAKPVRAKRASPKTAAAKKAVAEATPEPTPTPTPPPAPAPTPVQTAADDSLKNPKTGEVAKIPSTYTFAKRWIKDALVEEGLLEKVYKNNELDEATNAKIQAALQQLRAMDKYR